MESLGEMLRTRRLELGLSLEEVEEETKIRKYYIMALENNDFHLLPAMVYASGFVRRYARLLGLDPDETLREFKKSAVALEEPIEREEEIKLPVSRSQQLSIPVKNIVAGVAFLLVVVWLGIFLVDYIMPTSDLPNNNSSPPINNQEPLDPPPPPDSSEVEGINLHLTAIERCWVRVTEDDKSYADFTLQPGETREITADDKVILRLGNASGVKIDYNGEELGPAGESSSPITLEFPPEES
ncbi:MAG: helix-turn-helix domain-containing protein [Syntrophomonadaceae bacterium]|nr:helix-turn-helix domain-containing protein [Syntrophomonadaceae bacterium]